LPVRAATLSRLFLAQSSIRVSRAEAGMLRALVEAPCRITELAWREGVTQPAITLLANRMTARGWVRRESDPTDGRGVWVTQTAAGRQVWDRLLGEHRALLHEEMASLEDADVEVLARAVEILDHSTPALPAGPLDAQPARIAASAGTISRPTRSI
jgi:DNA-binding MarR family transcriptional regulator